MSNPLKPIRRVVQIIFLLMFLWFFWQARWHGVGQTAPQQPFLRMDALSAIATWLAPTPRPWGPFLPALAILVVTLLLGRVFCGWMCPLGTVIDIFDSLLLRKHRKRPEHLNRPAWKYYVLGLSLAAALMGTHLFWIVDPIPLLTRVCAVVLYPLAVGAYNVGVTVGWPVLKAAGLRLYPTDIDPGFSLNIAVSVVFAVVLGLSVLSRRYWCRTLCPLGALLAFFGRFGLMRRTVSGCVKCRGCVGECKMGAIPPPEQEDGDYARTLSAECIQCFDCLVCPQEGISAIGPALSAGATDARTGAGRRRFIGSLGLGLTYAATASAGGGRKATHERLIRPPGAFLRDADGGMRNMSEKQFRDLCLRCGACMKACITGGIQPAVVEAGFDGLFTPILVPKIGYCEQACTACGDVCPSGALRPFGMEEKKDIRIGLATVNQNMCLSWRRGELYRLCLVCDEHCPYDAIRVIDNHDGEMAPFVDPDVCVGCGQCENACPAKPEAAIVVRRDDVSI